MAENVQDKLSSSDKDFPSFDADSKGKQNSFYEAEDWGDSDYGFYQDDTMLEEGFTFSKYVPQQQQQRQLFTDYGLLDGVAFDAASPPIQTYFEETAKLDQVPPGIQDVSEMMKENHYPFSLSSLGLLNNYGSGFKRLKGERRIEAVNDIKVLTEKDKKQLSIEEIMRIAGEMFIESSSCQTIDSISMLDHPFNLSFSGLSDQETKDVELAVLLLASAEKVGYQQYDRASRLLKQCSCMSSKTGSPVQRVVYYFSEALREKIALEIGRSSSKGSSRKPPFNIDEAMMRPNSTTLACQTEFPFFQIAQFTGIQSIVENVAKAKRIHIIDLAVRNGVQWTILMQTLASRYACPVELLKLTAVATTAKHLMEETGKRLSSFAHNLGLPFAFKVVMVSDMLDLKEDLFELDAEETVAVYAGFAFRTMLAKPNRIENIMKVVKVINPCLMVVAEVEAKHNSPIFVNRFIEVLFFFSAYFDCAAACMKQDCRNREIIESVFFSEAIRNMLAAEGEEREIRHVSFDVWKAFFERYGIEEAELSTSSLLQADLILKNFACGNSCTLHRNGNCLLVGWKGTPMHSVSVWKFV